MLYDGPQLFVDHCWMMEAMKTDADQGWNDVLALLDKIFQIAQLPGGESLIVPAMRARAIVLADHLERHSRGLGFTRRGIPST